MDITKLQADLEIEKEHSAFLEKLLKLIYGTGWDKLTIQDAMKIARSRHLSSSSSRAAGNCPKCGKPLVMGVCETGCGHIPPPA